jgi:hypothetical protein
MAEWKIKSEDEDEYSEEDLDETELEDSEKESEPLEDILQGSTSGTGFRSSRQGISPFLEQEPIENLEQSLGQIPNTTNQEKTKEPEQPLLYNAPQYSGNYASGDYENMRKADRELDISGGALITRETEFNTGEQRRMDLNAWQQQTGQAQTQGEKYQIGKPERFKQQDDLPFQGQEKPRRI